MKLMFYCLFIISIPNIYYAQVNQHWQYNNQQPEPGKFILVDNGQFSYSIGDRGTIIKLNPNGGLVYKLPDTTQSFVPADAMFDYNEKLVILGTYQNSTGGNALKLEKRDTSGTIIWQTLIDNPTGSTEYSTSMAIDQNNDIYITGRNGWGQGKLYTAKISTTGSIIWQKDSLAGYHYGSDIAVYDSNNIYVVGTLVGAATDSWLVKYNMSGDTVWTRRFSYHQWINQFQMTDDLGKKVQIDSNGNIYILLHCDNNLYSIIIKYNPNGGTEWIKQIEPINYTIYEDFIVDNTGVYIGGTEIEIILSTDAYRIVGAKLDVNGNLIWDSKYTNKSIQGKKIVRHGDGLVVTGHTRVFSNSEWNYFTIRFDANGDTSWTHEKSTANGIFSDEPYDITTDDLGGIYITGLGNSSFYWLHTFKLFSSITSIETNTDNSKFLSIFPNPTNDYVNITSNLTGQINYSLMTVEGKVMILGSAVLPNKLSLDLKDFKSGIYFLRISGESANEFFKIVKL